MVETINNTMDLSHPQLIAEEEVQLDNGSDYYPEFHEFEEYEDPFNNMHVKMIFILLYGAVFTVSLIGNILVLVVISLHRQMRTITNFFLANLSIADLCVGVFCVLPNLLTYLSPYWILGQVMCKLYYFIQATCYTASVCILLVISIERYIAIIYPIHIRQLHSMYLLRSTVTFVWVISVAAGLPYVIFYDTVELPTVPRPNGTANATEDVKVYFCLTMRQFNVPVFNIVSLMLWYVLPLCLMAFVYTRISVVLWKSNHLVAGDNSTETLNHRRRRSSGNETSRLSNEEAAPTKNRKKARNSTTTTACSSSNANRNCLLIRNQTKPSRTASTTREPATSSDNVMTSRRRVIRLLIAVVLSFAICVLPYNIRSVWNTFTVPQMTYWQSLLNPASFVIYYSNSALNPVLYAFLSDKFRRCLYELVVKRYCGGNLYGNTLVRAGTVQQHVISMKTINVNYSAKPTGAEQSEQC